MRKKLRKISETKFFEKLFFQPPVLLKGISDSQKKNLAAKSVL